MSNLGGSALVDLSIFTQETPGSEFAGALSPNSVSTTDEE